MPPVHIAVPFQFAGGTTTAPPHDHQPILSPLVGTATMSGTVELPGVLKSWLAMRIIRMPVRRVACHAPGREDGAGNAQRMNGLPLTQWAATIASRQRARMPPANTFV